MHDPEAENRQQNVAYAKVSAAPPEADSALITMEYRMLREAMGKRVSIKYGMLQLNITLLGGIIVFGLQYKNPIILLFYPFLTLWLSIIWSQNNYETRNMSTYIIKYIETPGRGPGWERFNKTQLKTERRYDYLLKSLFVVSDLAVLWVGITALSQNIVLLCFSVICTLLTIIFLFVIARFRHTT